ncbi:MAG: aldo/keto reductase [Ahrensia sp.]|nr:aldo/keto reductase [Ahrensia sp.]
MKYRLLGYSGLRVSDIAFGTLNFGETKDWGVDRNEAHEILVTYADHGGTLIDTAPNYAGGAAETIVGEFIADQRERFVISTKYTASPDPHVLAGGNSARTMVNSVDASLTRLGTDYIDLLWLHFWDGTTPLDEILKAFEHLISAGKVRYFGFSDVPAWLVSRAVTLSELRGWARPIAVQVEYSLVARDAEREILPMAAALDLGVVGWGAMAAGALSGGSSPKRRPSEKIPDQIQKAVESLSLIAQDVGHSLPELALRWLMGRGLDSGVIPLIGARTASQLRETLAAGAGELDRDVLERIARETAPILGFPHDLIASPYLRRFAFGNDNEIRPFRARS